MSAFIDKALQLGAGGWFLLAGEPDSSQWQDQSGRSHHATVIGAEHSATGGPGVALPDYIDFDGIDDYASIPHHADFDRAGKATTLFGWAWLTNNGSGGDGLDEYYALFSKGRTNNTYRLNSSSRGGWSQADGRQLWYGEEGSTTDHADIPVGEWLMFAVVTDADPSNPAWLYIRGLNDNQFALAMELSESNVLDNAESFFLAARGSTSVVERLLDCRIAAIGGMDAELTLVQLDELYDATFEQPGIPAIIELAALQDPGTTDNHKIVYAARKP